MLRTEYGILTAIFPITHITDLHEGQEQPKQVHNNKRKQEKVRVDEYECTIGRVLIWPRSLGRIEGETRHQKVEDRERRRERQERHGRTDSSAARQRAEASRAGQQRPQRGQEAEQGCETISRRGDGSRRGTRGRGEFSQDRQEGRRGLEARAVQGHPSQDCKEDRSK